MQNHSADSPCLEDFFTQIPIAILSKNAKLCQKVASQTANHFGIAQRTWRSRGSVESVFQKPKGAQNSITAQLYTFQKSPPPSSKSLTHHIFRQTFSIISIATIKATEIPKVSIQAYCIPANGSFTFIP